MSVYLVYAPVIIPTLCRYEHFKRCIESLSRCTGAKETEIYIGLDYPFNESHVEGHKKISDYLETITGFKNVIVYRRDHNLGPGGNLRDLKDKITKIYDRWIFSEDDNEFAPNFLEYMNQCLTHFEKDPNVYFICGYTITWGIDMEKYMNTYKYNTFPAKDYNAMGTGFWRDKERRPAYRKTQVLHSWRLIFKTLWFNYGSAISRMIHQLNKESELPDVGNRLVCAFHNKYGIFPRVSKVRNWGYDGTGLNSDNNTDLTFSVELDTSPDFKLDDFEVKDYKEVKKLIKKIYQIRPGWRIEFLKQLIFFLVTGESIEDIGRRQRPRPYLINCIKKKLCFWKRK